MTRLLPLALALFAPCVALAEDCPFRGTPAEVDEVLGQAEANFSALDVDGFISSVDEAALLVPCVDGILPTATAAQLHRVKGIAYFNGDRKAQAAESLTAAKGLDPDYAFPTALLPAEHPIAAMFADAHPAGSQTVPAPQSGSLAFDGVIGLERPQLRATVVQVLGPDGMPSRTAYLHAADPMPGYEVAAPAVVEVKPEPLPTAPPVRKDGNGPLDTIVLASAAGLLYGTAVASRAAYLGPSNDGDARAAAHGWQAANNAVVVASGVAAAGAVVTLVLP